MIHSFEINGLTVKTGDLICTVNGGKTLIAGQFWWLIGKIIPGDVDHIAIYVGPGGKCVEAGAKGRVITFEMGSNTWDAGQMIMQRGIEDKFYGIAYPLEGRGLSGEEKKVFRESVAEYCQAQAAARKPYNLNFLNSSTDDAFYCSHLAYKAYLRHGIDLNSGEGVPDIPGTSSIIFPQEVWEGCTNKRWRNRSGTKITS
jgi:hypothetical protein